MTRAAKVEAFSSWSACRIRAMSSVRVAVSEGFSPRSIHRKLAEWRANGRAEQSPALADAVVDGHQHGDLRGQIVALAHVGVVRVVFLVGVEKAQRRDRRAQHLHGRCRAGKVRSISIMRWSIDRASVNCDWNSRSAKCWAGCRSKAGRWSPRRSNDGQLVDIDSAIGQHARISVDPADPEFAATIPSNPLPATAVDIAFEIPLQ